MEVTNDHRLCNPDRKRHGSEFGHVTFLGRPDFVPGKSNQYVFLFLGPNVDSREIEIVLRLSKANSRGKRRFPVRIKYYDNKGWRAYETSLLSIEYFAVIIEFVIEQSSTLASPWTRKRIWDPKGRVNGQWDNRRASIFFLWHGWVVVLPTFIYSRLVRIEMVKL